MIGLDRAIINRWNALVLDGSVSGSIWRSQVPERTNPPYCVFTVLSDEQIGQSRASRYSDRMVELKVYNSDDDALETIAQTVQRGFISAERAATNPLVSPIGNDGGVLAIRCEHNPIIIQESDQLWYATMTFLFRYGEDGGLTPG